MIIPNTQPINWKDIPHEVVNLPAKSVLLKAGKVANKLFVIQKGAVRMWYNNDGVDVTLQFFFEGSPICSFESFIKEIPSEFSIETLEPSIIVVIDKTDLLSYVEEHSNDKNMILSYLVNRLFEYTHLFLSRIKNSPQQRYKELLREHPYIIQRVPQHYIASYLGITSVSLSRIRNRK